MNFLRGKIGDYFIKGGWILSILSLIFLLFIFYPVIKTEWKFLFLQNNEPVEIQIDGENHKNKDQNKNVITPADKNFSIIIPKIGANEKIISNVNPFNQKEYLASLKDGIAHAKGTSFPGESGSIFLFAHSSGNFYENNRLNTIFLLLNKLEKGDQLSIIYRGKIYQYEIFDKKIVAEDQVEYMNNNKNEKIVTLMTCWPPGTAFKRLLVLGKPLN